MGLTVDFLVQQPKRRIPRANATPIDINKTRQWNNGNIEVIQADTAPQLARIPDKLNMDEVLINGRRYRVPERIITLDFWDKIARNRRGESSSDMWGSYILLSRRRANDTRSREIEASSGLSSPLTSLSSLDDGDSVPPYAMEPSVYSADDMTFAQVRRLLMIWQDKF